ncbi:hypothetical protein EB061_13150, partial [bacterium]|nr:hypothetical protein [bacterium]
MNLRKSRHQHPLFKAWTSVKPVTSLGALLGALGFLIGTAPASAAIGCMNLDYAQNLVSYYGIDLNSMGSSSGISAFGLKAEITGVIQPVFHSASAGDVHGAGTVMGLMDEDRGSILHRKLEKVIPQGHLAGLADSVAGGGQRSLSAVLGEIHSDGGGEATDELRIGFRDCAPRIFLEPTRIHEVIGIE